MNLENFARNLRHLRKQKKMTQKDLGKALFASRSLINGIERAKASPSLKLAMDACEYFEIDITTMTTADLTKKRA